MSDDRVSQRALLILSGALSPCLRSCDLSSRSQVRYHHHLSRSRHFFSHFSILNVDVRPSYPAFRITQEPTTRKFALVGVLPRERVKRQVGVTRDRSSMAKFHAASMAGSRKPKLCAGFQTCKNEHTVIVQLRHFPPPLSPLSTIHPFSFLILLPPDSPRILYL